MKNKLIIIVLSSWLILSACQQESTPSPSSPLPSATQAVATDLSPTDQPQPTATSTPSPTRIPPADQQRVMLISVEGGRSDWLTGENMPTLSGFQEMGASGVLQNVQPSGSVVSHHSLSCGCLPATHGIPGEKYHHPDDTLYWYTSAYSDEPQITPIWAQAKESGYTNAVLFWPALPIDNPAFHADYTINYGTLEARSTLHDLAFRPASGWSNLPEEAETLQETQFQIAGEDTVLATVYVLAIYEEGELGALILSAGDKIVSEDDGIFIPDEDLWLYWNFAPAEGLGADFLLRDVTAEGITLYQSAAYSIQAAPETLYAEITDGFSFFPPPPDFYALGQGWITEAHFMRMLSRQSGWMANVTRYIYETYQPDLTMTVQYPLRQAGQEFLLVDDLQPGYSAEKAARFEGYRGEAASILDSAINTITDPLQEDIVAGKTTLLITGTTGLLPLHTRVNINTILEDAGLLRLDNRNYVVVSGSQAIGFSSGGSAHININLSGRISSGIVSEDDYADIQTLIIETFQNINDPETGKPVFDLVLRRDELAAYGLDTLYAGDVFVQAAPGYVLSDWRGDDEVFLPASYTADSGFGVDLAGMQGGFIAAGGWALPGEDIGLVPLIGIGPTIAALMGFDLSASLDGIVITELIAP